MRREVIGHNGRQMRRKYVDRYTEKANYGQLMFIYQKAIETCHRTSSRVAGQISRTMPPPLEAIGKTQKHFLPVNKLSWVP